MTLKGATLVIRSRIALEKICALVTCFANVLPAARKRGRLT